jgi:phage terminase large subunit-like protein
MIATMPRVTHRIVPPMPDPTTAYARAVVADQIMTGRPVRLACRRHLDDLIYGPARGLTWDLPEANRVIDLIGEMPLPDGAPFVVQPSQEFIIGSLFGWKTKDGRRFRTGYVEEGKGNGKTPVAGRVGIVGIVGDGKYAAEVYTAGVTRDQAQYLWNDGKLVCESSPDLRALIDIGAFNLSCPATHSYMRPVSSEARSLDQKRVHMALIDEIHEHRTGDVVEKMRAGTKGDDSALIFEITNSGYDRHTICWQHHEYSLKVLSGAIQNDSWFAYIASLDACDKCHSEGEWQPRDGCPDCDDWRDEKVWTKPNPLLDVTITRRYLREQVQEAVDMPPKAALVKRLNFCIWTDASVGAIEMERWDTGNAAPTIQPGDDVYGGLDLSTTTDLSALLLMREADDGWLDLLPFFWCPKESIALRSRRDHVPYEQWVAEGWITATDGNRIDYEAIRRKISGYYVEDGTAKQDPACLAAAYHILEVGFDPYNATQLVAQLSSDSLTMITVHQGAAMLSAPTKDWLARIAGGKVRHGGNPVLRWMASNLVVRQDAQGNLLPDKDKSTERIDGQSAGITGLARLNAHIQEPSSIYEREDRGLVEV